MVTLFWGTICIHCGFPFFLNAGTKRTHCPSCMKYQRIVLKTKRSRVVAEFENKNDAIFWKTTIMEQIVNEKAAKIQRAIDEVNKK